MNARVLEFIQQQNANRTMEFAHHDVYVDSYYHDNYHDVYDDRYIDSYYDDSSRYDDSY